MTSQTTLETAQVCRHCGGRAPLEAHFCPHCSKILSIGRQGDYFSFLGLARRINIDATDLEQRFRALSRQFHPDYFYNATAAERRASLERSSYLNDAYRTLRRPIARIEYLLKLEGFAPKGPEEAGKEVPAALLEEVFALNEELDEIRELRASGVNTWKKRLERARLPIEAKRVAHERQLEELSAEWDRLGETAAPDSKPRPVLEALRQCLLERNYINNLLDGIQRELDPSRQSIV
jgi:molecular chaperone HscB